jgi:hypothetical protein
MLTRRDREAMDGEIIAKWEYVRELIDWDIVTPNGLVLICQPSEEELDDLLARRKGR